MLRRALLAMAAGAVLLVIGVFVAPAQAAFSYLAAYACLLALALGTLAFLLIVNAMNARWPVAVRRLCEHATATLPLFVPLFVPVALAARTLYPWTSPGDIADAAVRKIVVHRTAWLNLPFFVTRAAIYFAIWTAIAWRLRAWSLRQDRGEAPAALKLRMRVLSAAALPAFGLTLTFAAFDLTMSLTPDWYSSMYGVYFFAGGFIGAIAALTLLALGAERHHAADRFAPLSTSHTYALGRLMLAFTIFWAYIAYFQFFLIWIANKPHEVTWYLPRMHGSWAAVSVLLVAGHFGLPFLLLLPYGIKRRRRPLRAIAMWILAMHFVDMYWLVLPSLHRDAFTPHFADLGALLFVGGAVVAFGAWLARGHALVPKGDPALAAALAYESR